MIAVSVRYGVPNMGQCDSQIYDRLARIETLLSTTQGWKEYHEAILKDKLAELIKDTESGWDESEAWCILHAVNWIKKQRIDYTDMYDHCHVYNYAYSQCEKWEKAYKAGQIPNE